MRLAHIREHNAAAGADWRRGGCARFRRLALVRPRGRPPTGGRGGSEPSPRRVLIRQPITTLDDHLGRGLRVEALADLVERLRPARDRRRRCRPRRRRSRLRPADPPPARLRDFYAFERHVRTMWERRDGDPRGVVSPADLLLLQRLRDPRARRPGLGAGGVGGAGLRARGRRDRRHAAFDLPEERADEAIGGYFVLNDWSARDLQRDETAVRLGPAKGKDFAATIGPWIVTPDELADGGPRRRQGRSSRGGDRRDLGRPRGSVGERPVRVRRSWSPAPPRTCACAPASSSAAGPSAAVACSRSGRTPSGATWSRATRSRSRSSGWVAS